MYERILVATDGSEHAERAVEHALTVAAKFDATLHALSVVETRTAYDSAIVEPDVVTENLRKIGESALESVSDRAETRDVECVTELTEGVPSERIIEYCEANDVDLIFLGERGHSAFKTVLLGSTTEAVIHSSEVPVTVV